MMAQMVHEADLEDGKLQGCECIWINAVLSGCKRMRMRDAALLEMGLSISKPLYRHV